MASSIVPLDEGVEGCLPDTQGAAGSWLPVNRRVEGTRIVEGGHVMAVELLVGNVHIKEGCIFLLETVEWVGVPLTIFFVCHI